MKPATEKQKAQVFFMEPREEEELNSTQVDPQVQAAFLNTNAEQQSDFAQNTTSFD